MEQHERAVVDLSEGNTEQGGDATAAATAAVLAGEVAGTDDKERVSEVDSSVRRAALQSAKKQDLEVPSPGSDEVAAAAGTMEKEEIEALELPAAIATPFQFFRSAAAFALPLHISLRALARGRELAALTRFSAAGDADPAGGSEAAFLGASSSSAPAPASGTHGDQGAAPGDHGNLRQAGSAPGARWAIAHASPRDSYRPMPLRSRKQRPPKRSVAAAGASPSAATPPARDPPPQENPSASASETREASDDDTATSAASSKRAPSRGRKRPRPEHFSRGEAEATAGAKARRSGIALDRFVSCAVLGCPASRSEWAKNVTGDDS